MHEFTFAYANFSNTPHKGLPVELDVANTRLAHGTYCSVFIPSQEEYVLKLSRMILIDPSGSTSYSNVEQYLVDEEGESNPIDSLLELAKLKNEIHSVLDQYLNGHIPRRIGSCIVSSPRRLIECHRLAGHLTPETESLIPRNEVAIMEVYEKVHHLHDLHNMHAKELLKIVNSDNYLNSVQDMNSKLARVLLEQGIMVDICDVRLLVLSQTGELGIVSTQNELNRLITGEIDATVIPRNCAYDEGEVKIIDTFPVKWVPKNVLPLIPRIIDAVQSHNVNDLDTILKSYHHPKIYNEILWVVRYVVGLGFAKKGQSTVEV